MNVIDALISVARLTAEPGFTAEAAIDCQCARRNASSVERYMLKHLLAFNEYPPEWKLNAFKRMQINLM